MSFQLATPSFSQVTSKTSGSKLSKGFSLPLLSLSLFLVSSWFSVGSLALLTVCALESFSFAFLVDFSSTGSSGLSFLLTPVLFSFNSNISEVLIASTSYYSFLTFRLLIFLHFMIRWRPRYLSYDVFIWLWKNSSCFRFSSLR